MKKNVIAIFAILLALSAVLNIYQYFGSSGKSEKRALDKNLVNSCKLEVMGTAAKNSGETLWTVCDVNKDGKYDVLLITVDASTSVYKLNNKDVVKIGDMAGHGFCRCYTEPYILTSMVENDDESTLYLYEFAKDFSAVNVKLKYVVKGDSYTADGKAVDKVEYEDTQHKYYDKSNAIFQISRTDNWYLDACFNEVFV